MSNLFASVKQKINDFLSHYDNYSSRQVDESSIEIAVRTDKAVAVFDDTEGNAYELDIEYEPSSSKTEETVTLEDTVNNKSNSMTPESYEVIKSDLASIKGSLEKLLSQKGMYPKDEEEEKSELPDEEEKETEVEEKACDEPMVDKSEDDTSVTEKSSEDETEEVEPVSEKSEGTTEPVLKPQEGGEEAQEDKTEKSMPNLKTNRIDLWLHYLMANN
jgi:hypothetical protein